MEAPERNWIRLRHEPWLRKNLEIRAEVLRSIRRFFEERGFLEIDPPALVPLPGMEPHLDPMGVELRFRDGAVRRFYLHTSPEYCMKKLLSASLHRIYALGHVFRAGEISTTHNPEFMLLEWYRAGEDYRTIMSDCEELICYLARRLGKGAEIRYGDSVLDLGAPWPRIPVCQAMKQHAGVDLGPVRSVQDMVRVAHEKGYGEVDCSWPWEDIFYKIFLQEVEPRLPRERPFFLVDYPFEMAALARRSLEAPRWAERFELYAGELELANGFSELTNPWEQEARLLAEEKQRERMGRELYPVDRSFLEALHRGMPDAAGVALGVDRLVMLFTDSPQIRDVIPFPMEDLLLDWERSRTPHQP